MDATMLPEAGTLHKAPPSPQLGQISREQPGAANAARLVRLGLLALSALAIAALCFLFFKPEMIDKLKALSPYATSPAANPIITNPLPTRPAVVPAAVPDLAMKVPTNNSARVAASRTVNEHVIDGDAIRQQLFIGNWISRHYHIAGDPINLLVSTSYRAAQETSLDPLLILAVMSVESHFNPYTESALGAQGLMQVRPNAPQDRIGKRDGAHDMWNPVVNIRVGARLLKEDVMLGGSLTSGLKRYVDAAAPDGGAGDDRKILTEYHRLEQVETARNGKRKSATLLASN